MFAAAFWVKYNAAAFLPLLFFVPWVRIQESDGSVPRINLVLDRREWLLKISRFSAGFSLASGALFCSLWASGSWAAFEQEHFQVLARYSSLAIQRTPHYWTWAAGRIEVWLGSWTVCAALAALPLAWRRRHLDRLTPALLGAAAGIVAVAVQIRY